MFGFVRVYIVTCYLFMYLTVTQCKQQQNRQINKIQKMKLTKCLFLPILDNLFFTQHCQKSKWLNAIWLSTIFFILLYLLFDLNLNRNINNKNARYFYSCLATTSITLIKNNQHVNRKVKLWLTMQRCISSHPRRRVFTR